jgi:hypothetical protein
MQKLGGELYLTPIILATWEVKIGKITQFKVIPS